MMFKNIFITLLVFMPLFGLKAMDPQSHVKSLVQSSCSTIDTLLKQASFKKQELLLKSLEALDAGVQNNLRNYFFKNYYHALFKGSSHMPTLAQVTLPGLTYVTTFTCSSFTPNGHFIVLGAEDGNVYVLNKSTMQAQTLQAHKGPITCLTISRDGKYALTGSKDATIAVWDISENKCLAVLRGHTQSVIAVAFEYNSSGITRFFSFSKDFTMRTWSPTTWQCTNTSNLLGFFPQHRNIYLTCAVFHTQSKQLLVGYDSGRNELYHQYAGVLINWRGNFVATHLLAKSSQRAITAVNFTPGGREAIVGYKNGAIKVYATKDNEYGAVSYCGYGIIWPPVSCIALHPQNNYIAASSLHNTVFIARKIKNDLIELKDYNVHYDGISSLCFSPDGRYMLSTANNGVISIWDLYSIVDRLSIREIVSILYPKKAPFKFTLPTIM